MSKPKRTVGYRKPTRADLAAEASEEEHRRDVAARRKPKPTTFSATPRVTSPLPRVWTSDLDYLEAQRSNIFSLLGFLGEDPKREGLKETPARYIKAMLEMTRGYEQDPRAILKCFEDGSQGYDEMVLQRNIPLWSLCEHHLCPFFGVAHIAYIPDGKVVGLSKLSRLTDIFARRLQVQERLTAQIADTLDEVLSPLGVAVVIEARHTCIESRGVCKAGSETVTSKLLGAFKKKPEARAEFMQLVRQATGR